LGATVTGIDASKNNIKVAKFHAKEMNLNINYIECAPENLKFKNKFNVILNMEVVEHVSNVNLFIQNCSTLIEKNGIMFIATINKNLKSYLYAILGAEYILRWLPIGTHDWEKFLSPQELEIIAIRNNFTIDEMVGMKFDLFSKKIRQGETYQIKICTKYKNKSQINSVNFFWKLMKLNSSPESFMIRDKDFSIVSCSPETLIDKKGNSIITNPIAGTLRKNKSIIIKISFSYMFAVFYRIHVVSMCVRKYFFN